MFSIRNVVKTIEPEMIIGGLAAVVFLWIAYGIIETDRALIAHLKQQQTVRTVCEEGVK